MSLKSDLAAWDGRSADDIAAIHADHGESARFVTRLLDAMADPILQAGATWMLKRHFEYGGRRLTSAEGRRFLAVAPKLEGWAARVHLLQSVDHVPIDSESAEGFRAFVERAIVDESPLVRAWAWHGLHALAVADPARRREVRRRLAAALDGETKASVRARLRALINADFPID